MFLAPITLAYLEGYGTAKQKNKPDVPSSYCLQRKRAYAEGYRQGLMELKKSEEHYHSGYVDGYFKYPCDYRNCEDQAHYVAYSNGYKAGSLDSALNREIDHE